MLGLPSSLFERLGKATLFGDSLLVNLFQPLIKAFPFSLSQHRRKFLGQFIDLSDFLISFTEVNDMLLLPFQSLVFLKGDSMSDLRSRWGTLGRSFCVVSSQEVHSSVRKIS